MIRCFVDIDGVLTDFPRAYNERFGLNIPLKKFTEEQFPIEVGKSIEQIDAELDKEFWANLPWLPWGRSIMTLLEAYFGRQNICLLSFPSYTPDGPAGKMQWIYENIIQYRMRFILATNKRFCAGPNAVLFDDKPRNVEEFKNAGGQAILVPAPWNHLWVQWYYDDTKAISNFLKTEIEQNFYQTC